MRLTRGLVGLVLAMSVAASAAETEGNALAQVRVVWTLNPTADREAELRWLASRPWVWGVEANHHTTPEELRAADARGLFPLMYLIASERTRDRQYRVYRNEPVPDFDAVAQRTLAVFGDRAVIQIFIEDDSAGVAFPQVLLEEKPQTHREAFDLFEAYLRDAVAIAAPYREAEFWGMTGYAKTAHAFARHGVDTIIVERTNDDVEDLQTGIAFGRGAARQFGVNWGLDLSLWWGVIYGVVHDLDGSLYERHLWHGHLAGAQAYRIEGGDIMLRGESVSALAETFDATFRAMMTVEAGEADVPVAILLPEDHGWMTPPYWRTTNTAWSYARIPYRQGQRALDGFFGHVFPGSVYAMDGFPFGTYAVDDPPASPFALSVVTPEFAPSPEDEYAAEPPLPFGRFRDRNEARAAFTEGELASAPYRPMGDSRYGDIFDVLMAEGPLEALADYQCVVLLDQVDLTDALAARLRAFAEGGGTVILAAGVARPEHAALTGVDMTPELRVGRAWHWEGDTEATAEAFRYLPAQPLPDAPVTVLATAPDGLPLVTRHAIGEGAVVTCLVPWFEGGHTNLSALAARLFDEQFRPLQPVTIHGLPVAWTTSRHADGARSMVITNNDGVPREVSVRLVATGAPDAPLVDALTGETLLDATAKASESAMISIAPFGVRVLRW